MWEIRPYEFMLVCISNRPENEDDPPNNNYVLNVNTHEIR